ncbi:hypothetical protein [Flavobacterium sp. KACC 22761]|uniref:hypothetical protein n=1 Tax=Flavobacterium sp. KACC 22761 TaxID=3092665 RepID=UPI002A7643BE|nr:hypothetical protein [Flavobacterium sp. KACC 22761]WPO78182.1 hypothetical protein SCB73_18110 [Flavobacterium sp. KACC 22761]
MKQLDDFYQNLEEPTKGIFLALRDIILKQDKDITHVLKYGMRFFVTKEKCFAICGFIKSTKNRI